MQSSVLAFSGRFEKSYVFFSLYPFPTSLRERRQPMGLLQNRRQSQRTSPKRMALMGPMGQRHWNATTPVSSKVRILNPNWNVKQSDPPFLVSSCAFVSEQPDRVSGSSGSSLTTANCFCEKLRSAAMCGMHDVQITVGFSKWGSCPSPQSMWRNPELNLQPALEQRSDGSYREVECGCVSPAGSE